MKFSIGGKSVQHNVADDLRESCESILPPIVETVVDLISRYEPEFQELARRNVYLAVGGSQIDGIDKALEGALSEYRTFKITVVKDPLYAGADGAGPGEGYAGRVLGRYVSRPVRASFRTSAVSRPVYIFPVICRTHNTRPLHGIRYISEMVSSPRNGRL
ncbi:MAG: hypothetical protein WD275_04640 [Rhodothermales bacterium]